MTSEKDTQEDEKSIQMLEEICENTRAIRRVVIGEMPFRTTAEIVDALMPYLSRLPRQDIRIR